MLLAQSRSSVHPDPIDAAVEPEAQNVVERLEHLLVTPIEVRLFDGKCVEILLAGLAVCLDHLFPARATEAADPIVRRLIAPLDPCHLGTGSDRVLVNQTLHDVPPETRGAGLMCGWERGR